MMERSEPSRRISTQHLANGFLGLMWVVILGAAAFSLWNGNLLKATRACGFLLMVF